MHTDLKVGKYWGDMGVDFWDGATWKEEMSKHEVNSYIYKIIKSFMSYMYSIQVITLLT